MLHDYVYERGHDQFRWIIYCRHCGYVSAYGNDPNETRDRRQVNLPAVCRNGENEPWNVRDAAPGEKR